MLEFFENLLRKFNFRWNLTRITGTLHNDQHKFLIIPCSVLLRMRNVSGKSFRESQSKHFMFNNVFIKSYRLWDNVEKIMHTQTGWRWQYGECAYHDTYLKLHTHKHTHTQTHARSRAEYVIIITFLQQQWFYKRASTLCLTYISCLVTGKYSV